MSLYFQPVPTRTNENSLPTAPSQGEDVYALIDELTNRINQATKKIEHKVDASALAKIILTDKDIVLMGDQVSVVGQLNVVDWIRDMSGHPTGGIDPASMTRIVGGKIQTGIIESFNWSVMAGSQIDLDNGTIVLGGTTSPKFSVSSTGVLTCIDANIEGTLTAGSIIAGSVTIDTPDGMTIYDIIEGSDVESALEAGVGKIVAGVGGDYLLDVNPTSGYAIFRHKDAVFLGTAAAGSVRPALGISAAGVMLGHNRADGAWVTSVTIDASGNAAFLGTVTAGSVVANTVTISGTGLSMGDVANQSTAGQNISDALKISGTTILKGTIKPTDTGALAVGSITWNSTTGALTGGTGIAITEWGIIGAASGVETFSIQASSGTAVFRGDIIGGANISITGKAVFEGAFLNAGVTAAVHANTSGASLYGINTRAGGAAGVAINASGAVAGADGVSASATGSGGRGIYSLGSSSAVAIEAESSGAGDVVVATSYGAGAAVRCVANSTGPALDVEGTMTMTSTTRVVNLNADMVDGIHAAALCQGSNTNSGLSTVSGNVLNIQCAGTLLSTVHTRASGNAVVIENVSDRRLKRDIEDEEFGLDFIRRLRPRSFHLIAHPALRGHGLVYQEVHEIVGKNGDSLASLNSDGTGAVDYNGMIAPIIKAIQQLADKLDNHG